MAGDEDGGGFTAAERAAMKERAAELRAASGATGRKKAEREAQALVDAIAALPEADRAIAQRVDDIVTAVAPQLAPKTYYGMPAWAEDGKVVVFVQPSSKFDVRYSTLGFEQPAKLDEGEMWPTSFAILEITPQVAERIEQLVRRATS
jgi:uncharacterized protein YdhG (YjbR/CyaY superfamily)